MQRCFQSKCYNISVIMLRVCTLVLFIIIIIIYYYYYCCCYYSNLSVSINIILSVCDCLVLWFAVPSPQERSRPQLSLRRRAKEADSTGNATIATPAHSLPPYQPRTQHTPSAVSQPSGAQVWSCRMAA